MQERVVREIRTLRAMWRALARGSPPGPKGDEGGKPGHKPRVSLRATAPPADPTRLLLAGMSQEPAVLLVLATHCYHLPLQVLSPRAGRPSPYGQDIHAAR